MKKLLSILMAGLVVFMMFGVGGGSALAAPKEKIEKCSCETNLTIAQKNKIISDFLLTDTFNNVKALAVEFGFKWRGVDQLDVNRVGDSIWYMVPFYNSEGKLEYFFVIDNEYITHFSYDWLVQL